MIFQDHVQWPSTEEEKKHYNSLLADFTKAMGGKIKWPVTVMFHPKRVKQIPDSEEVGGYRIEKPAGMRVILEATATGFDKRKHVFTYCDNYDPDPVTKKNKYIPRAINIDGAKICSEEEIEFLLWLFLAYPGIKGGKNEDPSKECLVFDLPLLDKQKANAFDSMYSEVLTLITNRKMGLPMADIRKMLTSYFVPNVDDMEDVEVMDEMKKKATEGATNEQKIESMKLFLFRNGNAEGLRVRWLCQKGLEEQLIKFMDKGRTFNMIIDGKPIDPPICKVQPNQDKFQTLHETMGGVPENKDYLLMIENYLNAKAGDKKAKKDKEE